MIGLRCISLKPLSSLQLQKLTINYSHNINNHNCNRYLVNESIETKASEIYINGSCGRQ